MNSIKFCDTEMFDKLSQFAILTESLHKKQEEISTHNQKYNLDPSGASNGRQQTNIGIFRAYIKAYLANNSKIHKDITFLVRQLSPTATGPPLKSYVFSNDQVWAKYEDVQANIFDPILAVLPEFGPQIFLGPPGHDFHKLQQRY